VKLRFATLALVQGFALYGMVDAQLPPRLERCLPYPTLAQEISEMQEETRAQEPAPVPSPRIVIAVIQFVPSTHISESVRSRIIRAIKSPQFYDDAKMDWLEELQDVGLRGTLQDLGYFNAKVRIDARLLDVNQRRNRYTLTLHIEEGRQYRLGNVRFKPADPDKLRLVFSPSDLRQYVHMSSGDFFSGSKVRSSMEEITKLYATKGYIDMVAEPEVRNDDDRGIIDLTMKIDEGKQYRVGRVDFVGLDESSQNQLKSQLRPGEPFNKARVDELLKRYKSLLPADASWQDVRLKRNTKEGVVDMNFDFYSCPQWATAGASARQR
jgi:outer membrane protein assembly factor BamA